MGRVIGVLILLALCVCLFPGCAAHCGSARCRPVDRGDLTIVNLPRPPASVPIYEAAVFGTPGNQPILLTHAMNGVSSETLELAEKIAGWDYHVFVPNLYRDPELDFGANDVFRARNYMIRSGEWRYKSYEGGGPFVDHVAEMAADIRRQTGRRVIVVGNCLTGITPLELIASDAVRSGVLCQPATPLATVPEILSRRLPQKKRESPGVSDATLDAALAAMNRDSSKQLAGFHFSHDPVAPMERFEVLRKELVAQGLEGRFSTFVLYPEGEEPESWWTDSEATTVRAKLTKPHSTIIAAENDDDLIWFHDRLREVLRDL